MTSTPSVPFLDLPALHRRHRVDLDRAMASIVDTGAFIAGEAVDVFEDQFARYCGVRHCIGVANGTDALELILAGLGIGPASEVVLPANTFVATVEAVIACGARPRFVDVRPDTLLIDPDEVAAAIGPSTAAIIAVHLYGQIADMEALTSIAERRGLAVIEDAAQAHGARFDGRRAGRLGRAAAFSFYPGKNLGAFGDAGAVVTDDDALAAAVRLLANHGRDPEDRFQHLVSGRNSRLDGLQAAVLSVKLAHLDADNARRRSLMSIYHDRLPAGFTPVVVDPRVEPVHHVAVVRTADRSAACHTLDRAGVGWGLHYPVPCHMQPAFAGLADRPLPVVEAAAAQILSLPMSPTLTDSQIVLACEALASSLAAGT